MIWFGLLSLLPQGVAFFDGFMQLFLERPFLVSLCGFHLRSSYVPLVFDFPKVFAVKSNLHPLIIVIAILNLSWLKRLTGVLEMSPEEKISLKEALKTCFTLYVIFFSIQINTSPDFMNRNVESQTFCEHDGCGNHCAWILFIWTLSGRRTSIVVLAVPSPPRPPPPPSLSQRLFA